VEANDYVISNLKAALDGLQQQQKGTTTPSTARVRAVAITDLEKVIAWLSFFAQ
jgi:hypothetical protein